MSEDEEDSQPSTGEESSNESGADGKVSEFGSDGSMDDDDKEQNESSKKVVNIPPSERIRDLMAIDADVSKILQTAGEAMKGLANPCSSDLEQSKESFAAKSQDFAVMVQSVTARLRRQVYALEEAKIIPAKRAGLQAAAPAPQPGRPGQPVQQPPMQITNGGLGNLDVGWLNSRSGMVGKQKEADLWADARRQLESVLGEQRDDMEVDDGSPG